MRLALLALWLAVVVICTAWLSSVLLPHETLVDPDYMWQPLEIADSAKVALGLATTAVAIAICVLLYRLLELGRLSRNWLVVFGAGGAIAAYCGLVYGVATSPVIGANIGAGIMLLFAGPFAVVIVIVALVIARTGRRTSA